VVTRPSGPHYLALVEALLQLLDQGGIPADRAAWGIDVLLQLATSGAAEHGSRNALADRKDFNQLSTAMRTASADVYPAIAASAEDMLAGTGPERSRWRYDVLIAGFLHTPRP
jgi:hypothetical protein